MKEVLNDLYDYENLKIYQYEDGFKFSLDSILLAEYVRLNSKIKSILDFCTGNAVVPLILSTRTNAKIDCVEVQKSIYDLAQKSIIYNKLNNQITLYNESIKDIDKCLKSKKYDIITCNPPYFKVNTSSLLNNNAIEAIARHEILINLDDIFRIASSYLNDKGEFYLVHRANRIDEIIIFAKKYNLGVKNIDFIKTKESNPPSIILVRCLKNAKWGVKINNVISIDKLSTYQNLFKEEI